MENNTLLYGRTYVDWIQLTQDQGQYVVKKVVEVMITRKGPHIFIS
jgi:hypothetical protein